MLIMPVYLRVRVPQKLPRLENTDLLETNLLLAVEEVYYFLTFIVLISRFVPVVNQHVASFLSARYFYSSVTGHLYNLLLQLTLRSLLLFSMTFMI